MPRLPHFFIPFVVLAVFSFALALPVAGFAADSSASQSHDQAQATPAGKFVQDLGTRAIAIIANKKITPDQRNVDFSNIMNDCFDLKTIGRFVIGRSWNSATPAQQQEYMDLFKALIIKTYGSRMTLYTGEGFQVVATHSESDMDTTVNSEITHPDGSKPTVIDWRIRQKDGKMGVIDVVVEGVSLSVTQRQEYAAIIQNHDGKIDALLKQMRDELNAPPDPPEHG